MFLPLGHQKMIDGYRKTLDAFVGSTKVFVAGNTRQVKDYSRYDWTIFDGNAKVERYEKVFPEEKKKAFLLGADMVREPW